MRTFTARAADNAAPLRMARMLLLNCMVGPERKIELEGRGGEKTADFVKKVEGGKW